MRNHIFTVVLSVLALGLCCTAARAISITVSPSGSGTFSIHGEAMNGVSGMQLTLGYDSAALSAPSVVQGSLVSGALLTSNTTTPGTIKIAIVRPSPFYGNGQIAAISFAGYNGSNGISSINARLIDANGANLPVFASITAGTSTPITAVAPPAPAPQATAAPASQPAAGVTTGTTFTSSTSGATLLPGTVTMPGETRINEPKPPEPPVSPPPEAVARADEAPSRPREEPEGKPVPPEKVAEPKQISYASVLDRFKAYDGERTPATMLALFEKPVAKELRQEPTIAISDGATSIRLHAALPKSAGSSPSFNLSGVELVSLQQDDESGALVLELLPKKNSMRASVVIVTGHVVISYPLTVVPPAITPAGADFAAFMRDSGAKKPKFDLDGDGIHDYRDDYIATGLYLTRKPAVIKKP